MVEIGIDPRGDDQVIFRLSGRLDLLGAGPFRDALRDEVRGGRHRVVVDLAAVPYVDSSGIGALIGGLRTAREAGGELRIAAPTPQMIAVLELTTVNRILTPYATVEEALDGL